MKKIYILYFLIVIVTSNSFSQNLYKTNKLAKFGVVDKKGHTVLPAIYHNIKIYDYGYIVAKKYKNYGIFDFQGNAITDIEYSDIKVCNEKIIYLSKGKKKYLFNPNDKTKIDCKRNSFFKQINSNQYFYFNKDKLILHNSSTNTNQKFDADSISNLQRFMSEKEPSDITNIFFNSISNPSYYYIIFKDNREGLFDANLNLIVPMIYKNIEIERTFISVSNRSLKGAFNKKGELVLPLEFEDISSLGDGYLVLDDRGYGYYNQKGKLIVPALYQQVIMRGKNFIVKENNSYGIYNKAGKKTLDTKYSEIYITNYKTFFIYSSKTFGFANTEGELLIPPKYKYMNHLTDSFLVVKEKFKKGVVSINDKEIVPQKYSSIEVASNKAFIVSNKKKYGLYSSTGENLIKLKYDTMSVLSNELILVEKNNKVGAVNYNGELVIPLDYKSIIPTNNKFIFFVYSSSYGVSNIYGEKLLDTLYIKNKITIEQSFVNLNKDTSYTLINIDEKGKFVEQMELLNFFSYQVYEQKEKSFWKQDLNNEQNYWGLFSADNAQLIDYKYDSYTENYFSETSLVLVHGEQDNTGYGIVNMETGKEILTCNFSEFNIKDFEKSNVMRAYIENGLCILLNKKGHCIGENEPRYIDDFEDGSTRIAVNGKLYNNEKITSFNLNVNGVFEYQNEVKNGIWGVIDTNGKYLIKPKYKFIQKQHNGKYIALNKYNKWGLINPQGSELVTFNYDNLSYFKKQPYSDYWVENDFIKAKKGNKIGVIDTLNNQIVDFKYDKIKYLGNKKGHFFAVKLENKWGLIDNFQKIIVPITFDSIQYLSENNKMLFKTFNNEPRSGFIDTNGIEVVKPIYLFATNFVDGRATVKIDEDKWQYINSSSYQFISKQAFTKTNEFSEGFALFYEDGGYGFINKRGDIVIKPKYLNAGNFKSGRACVQTKRIGINKIDYLYGYIDTNENFVVKPKFKHCTSYEREIAFARKNKNYAVINKKGKNITAYKYHDIDFDAVNNIFRVLNKNNKPVLFNTNGEKIVRANKYNSIGEFSCGMAKVKKGEFYGYVSNEGIEIKPKFARCLDFVDSVAIVLDVDLNKYYINTKGEKIEHKFENHKNTNNHLEDYQKIIKNDFGKYGVIDKNGFSILLPTVDMLSDFENGHAVYTINSQIGLYDYTGKEIAEQLYIEITEIGDLIKLQGTSQCIYIDEKGNIIWE